MVAAAKSSLPKRAEVGRNYYCRCVWVRDQCFAGLAAAASGRHRVLDDAVGFVTDRLLAASLQPRITHPCALTEPNSERFRL